MGGEKIMKTNFLKVIILMLIAILIHIMIIVSKEIQKLNDKIKEIETEQYIQNTNCVL